MDKMKFETPNLTEKNIDKIAELFPSVITESVDENGNLKKAINFDMLRQLLSEDIAVGDEAYEFTWVGKKASIVEASKPIRKTLRPCKDESVNWDTTENLYIEGDNLEVLKLLQESYLGKVKMIYIDPPYNTGNDFIYRDNFKMDKDEYEDQIGLFDEDDNKLFDENNPSNPRFHSDWCSMIYPRLMLARNLLSDDGVIFISIDEHEYSNLKSICDEVFGAVNHLGSFIWRKKDGGGQAKEAFIIEHEYILVYQKTDSFYWFSKEEIRKETEYTKSDALGRYKVTKLAKWGNTARKEDRPSMYFSITAPDNTEVFPIAPDGGDGRWRVGKEKMNELLKNDLIHWEKKGDNWIPYEKEYFSNQTKTIKERSILYDLANTGDGSNALTYLFEKKDVFENPKPVELVSKFISCSTSDNDIILDFFSGSGTTAEAVMFQNVMDMYHKQKLTKRKFILVQFPELTDKKTEAYKMGLKTISEIGKERIRRAGKNEYMSVCGTAGSSLRWDSQKRGRDANYPCPESIDYGFRVFKIAESNMNDVYYSPAEYDQTMLDYLESNIKPDRTALDLLFGCLLEWGLPLSMPYFSENIEGANVHTYNNGDLIACFDENVSEDVIKIIAKRKPLRAVFRDSSFADSPSKINVFEIFKLYSPETRVKVI